MRLSQLRPNAAVPAREFRFSAPSGVPGGGSVASARATRAPAASSRPRRRASSRATPPNRRYSSRSLAGQYVEVARHRFRIAAGDRTGQRPRRVLPPQIVQRARPRAGRAPPRHPLRSDRWSTADPARSPPPPRSSSTRIPRRHGSAACPRPAAGMGGVRCRARAVRRRSPPAAFLRRPPTPRADAPGRAPAPPASARDGASRGRRPPATAPPGPVTQQTREMEHHLARLIAA